MPRLERHDDCYLGIDPGASGGLVALDNGKVYSTPMPGSERDIWEWLFNQRTDCVAVIEKVGGYVGTGQPGSAMFKFGRSAGLLTGFLIAASIPYEEITPQAWQKGLGIPPRKAKDGESKPDFKRRLRAKAQQLFPSEKVTLATADALLIALYCKRKHTGTLER